MTENCGIKNFFYCLFIFERERKTETECEWRRSRERGRQRIWSRLHTLSCQHRARCRARTHKPLDHDLSWSWMLNRLSHPSAPDCGIKKKVYLFILRKRDKRACTSMGRGREREYQAHPMLSAQSPTWSLISHEIMTWAEIKSLTRNWLSHLGTPENCGILHPSYLTLLTYSPCSAMD